MKLKEVCESTGLSRKTIRLYEEKGLLVPTAKSRLRLLPPLTLTAHDVEKALGILNEVLTEMEQKAPKEQA